MSPLSRRVPFVFAIAIVIGALCLGAHTAFAAYRVPFKHARYPHVVVKLDPDDSTGLLAVHNTDDRSVSFLVRVGKQDGTVAFAENYTLEGKATKTWNLRQLPLPFENGAFKGYVEVIATRRVLIGDFMSSNSGISRMEANQLIPDREDTALTCQEWVLRYLVGGNFAGGTRIQTLHEAGPSGPIGVDLYDEEGRAIGGFTVLNAPCSHEINLSNRRPASPFGTAYVHLPAPGVVTGIYSANGKYSGGLEAWCIPSCEPGNPSCGSECSPCSISATGSRSCTVDSFCSTTFRAIGTNCNALQFGALPPGLVQTGDVVAGTPSGTGSYTVSVSGQCGQDAVTIGVDLCTPSTEVCTNGIDDDCDGLVDTADSDCSCSPAQVVLSGNGSCTVGSYCSTTFTVSGSGAGPLICTTLPAGLSRTGNTVAGTPSQTGTYTCSVSASCNGTVTTGSASVAIGQAPPAEHPAINVKKRTNGDDSDTAPGPELVAGSAVSWTYVVTNTGDVTLGSVTVSDNRGVTVSCPKSSLQPAEAMTCTGSGVATVGQYQNIGIACGRSPGNAQVCDEDLAHYLGKASCEATPAYSVSGPFRDYWSGNQGVRTGATVRFDNAGQWEARIYGTDGGNTWLKDQEQVTLACGQSKTFAPGTPFGDGNPRPNNDNLFYGCQSCHTGTTFRLEIWKNGSRVQTIPLD